MSFGRLKKMIPMRQIRADFDDQHLTVYQAYSPTIAVPAAANTTFVGTPFKRDRMTWIKPSFLWMMYRCGWATKPGQEHVLAVRISRLGFEQALSESCLSHFDRQTYHDHESWESRRDNTSVRVQWDPERGLRLERLEWRSIQIGLAGKAVADYLDDWIIDITDITEAVCEIKTLVDAGQYDAATSRLPTERPYPLPDSIATVIGASRS